MATNSLLTTSLVTKEALRILKGNLNFTKHMNRDYEDKFGARPMKFGETISVRKRPKYLGRDSITASAENSVDGFVALTVNKVAGVDIEFTSSELTLSVEDFADRYVKSAMNVIANKVESTIIKEATWATANTAGAIGTVPASNAVYSRANAIINANGGSQGDMRTIMLDPFAMDKAAQLSLTIFNPQQEISEQYRTGLVSRAFNMNWYIANNMASHTVGTYSGTPKVDGGSQTGSTLLTDGWGVGSALKKGDVITIDGVYAVNPNTKESLSVLKEFVVTEDCVAVGSPSTAMSISISPAIVTTGAHKNVSAGPADTADINVFGASGATTTYGLAFDRDAFTFVSVRLDLPAGLPASASAIERDPETGIYLRTVNYYDGVNDLNKMRFDVLYGFAATYPELAVKIATV